MQVNSKAYWDHRFGTDWIGNHGKQQSAFFATLALNAFPSWLGSDIIQQKLSVCDWGCALGDGTQVFQQAFPDNAWTGIDFSEVAIEGAKQAYPHIDFLATNLLDEGPSARYDVLFSSNTLEHFSEPWKILAHLSGYARRHLAILIPYKEYQRYSEHLYSFDENTIPAKIANSFFLTHIEIIDGSSYSPSFWGDLQVLLVFSHMKAIAELGLKTIDDSGIRATEGLYRQKLILQQLKETRESLAEQLGLSAAKMAREAEEQRKNLAEKEAIIQHQRHLLEMRQVMNTQSLMEDQLRQKEATIAAMRKEIEGAALHITSLEKRMAEDKGQIQTLSSEREDLALQLEKKLAEKEAEIDELRGQLKKEQEQLASEIGETAKYELEARRLEEELEKWKAEATGKKELEERLEGLEAALKSVKEESESALVQLHSEKDKAIEDLNIRLESSLRGHESARQALEKERAASGLHAERLQKELAAVQSRLSAEIQVLKEGEKQAATRKTMLEEEIDKLGKDKTRLEEEKERLKEERRRWMAENGKLLEDKKKLEEERKKLEADKRRLEEGKKRLEADQGSLEQKITAGLQQNAGLQNRIKALEEGAARDQAALEKKLAEKEGALSALQAELEQRKQSQTEMYRSISDLQNYTGKLQKDLEWYRSTFEDRSLWGVLKEKMKKSPGK